MALPPTSSIEMPVLQELYAVGGSDDVRYLYERLISYFPSLSDAEIAAIRNRKSPRWRAFVQKAGKTLDEEKLIRRERGRWFLTDKGRARVELETSGFALTRTADDPLSHRAVQEMLVEIGTILGFHAEMEFEYYDVVWRETRQSTRISHVFEVQSKGNIDSAFAKLKRAFDAQRSKPFLILASERDSNRAVRSLELEFRELRRAITIISFVELKRIHDNLKQLSAILPRFLDV